MIRDHEKEGHFSLLPALLASIVILNMGISSSGVVGDYQPDGKKRQAVITGIGVVSPLGIGIDPFWTSLIAGETGVDEISLFDASSFPGRLAAEVKDFHPEHYLSKKTLRPLSRQSQMAAVGYLLALQDANLKPEELNGLTDVIIGSAEGSYALVEQQFANHPVLLTKYEKGLADPFTLLKGVIIGPMLAIARLSGAKGYTTTVSSACTSGVNAVGLAAQRIEDGRSRCAIAGGVDCPIFASMVTGFTEARITTTSNNPNDLKPYDRNRTRYALAEGAGIFIVEDAEYARARGARIYARISGWAQGTENHNDIFSLDTSGEAWAATIRSAIEGKTLKTRGLYVSGHGPSDKYIDAAEVNAIQKALGPKSKALKISSIKAATGNGFASAGAFQVAAAAKTIETGTIPPTRNFQKADPDNKLKVIFKSLFRKPVRQVIVNSHGLGSVNSVLLMERHT